MANLRAGNHLISIVVPSFQQGPFVEKCLESIVTQNCGPIEIIVFDSESDDETTSVLKSFENIAEVSVERDLGQAHAINKGLKRCKGDIIGFLNSDDLLLPDSLGKVFDYWCMHPSTDLLYGKARYIDFDGNVKQDYRTQKWDWEKFQGECFFCQPATFWSRRIMEKVGFMNQKLHCSLDYDYWLRIVQAGGNIAYTDQYLACSRDYPQTKTRNLRGIVFQENIMISLRRLGFVHESWISQYMDYFKYEKRGFWSNAIPASGKLRDRITLLLRRLSSTWARDVFFTEKPYTRIV